jgi:hypothetical protein
MEKKRLDPRVRFQHANFTRKLEQARNYKRVSRPRPDSRLQAGLEKVGFAHLLPQLLLAAALILVAYVLYVPNPLFIQKVEIEGLSAEYQSLAQNAVADYQRRQPWYVPVNNFFFFSASAAAQTLANQVPAISKIDSARKSFRGKIIHIAVTQKYERYLVVRPENELVLYNDGTIKGQMPLQEDLLPHSGMLITVTVNHLTPVNDGQEYFTPPFLALVDQAATLFPQRTGQNLAYFEVKLPTEDPNLSDQFSDSWKQSGIVAVVDKKPESGNSNPKQLRIILEPGLDIAAAADRLKLLLDQTAPDRYRSLYYADLRLPNRAYLCLINTPCATTNTNPLPNP